LQVQESAGSTKRNSLRVGDAIAIVGLRQRAEMNGQEGIVWQAVAADDQDHVLVRLNSTQAVVKLRRSNVCPAEPRAASVAGSSFRGAIRTSAGDEFRRSRSSISMDAADFGDNGSHSYAANENRPGVSSMPTGDRRSQANVYESHPTAPLPGGSNVNRSTRRSTLAGDSLREGISRPSATMEVTPRGHFEGRERPAIEPGSLKRHKPQRSYIYQEG
jgi:hypothetical protein